MIAPFRTTLVLTCTVVTLLACAADATTIIHVNHAAAGAGTGVDWANACTDLQVALIAADAVVAGGDDVEIRVAAGTYKPTADPFDRTASFELRSRVAIYGGFSGDEAERDARNPQANRTILSGDIDADDLMPGDPACDATRIQGANSYHVVVGNGVDDTAVLDGFVITGGSATGEAADGRGGGMSITDARPILRELTICGNAAGFGGGICSRGATTVATMEHVTITHNTAVSAGGIANENEATVVLSDCAVVHNAASNGHGGGLSNRGATATLINVRMSENRTVEPDPHDDVGAGYGGAVYNGWCRGAGVCLTMTNVLVYGNEAYAGGGFCMAGHGDALLTNVTMTENSATYHDAILIVSNFDYATASVINSIIWDNPSGEGADDDIGVFEAARLIISHSDVERPGGSTNIHEDPLFTDFGHLQAGSPAIDLGVPQPGLPGTDLDGNPRVIGAAADLGAYEYEPPLTLHADMTPVTCHGGSNGAVDLTVSGGTGIHDITWSPGSAATEDLAGVAAGTYTVTVTDTNGCRETLSVTVTEPLADVVTLTFEPMGTRDGTDLPIVQMSDRLRIDATTSPSSSGALAYTLKRLGAFTQDLGAPSVAGGVAQTVEPPIWPHRARTGFYLLEALFTSSSGCTSLTTREVIVDPEDVTVTPHPDNRSAFTQTEGSAGFTLGFKIRETYPEPYGDPPGAEPANINWALIYAELRPVAGSRSMGVVCTPGPEVTAGYEERTFSCFFDDMPVDTYEVVATASSAFRGSWLDALTIYDPSAGFVTGGGTFLEPASGDRVNFGLVYRLAGKGKTPRGNLLVIRHMENGHVCRVKSNAIAAPAISGNAASFSGKGSYLCTRPDGTTYGEAGNLAITGWVEDNENSGEPDRIWIRVPGTALEMVKPIGSNAAPLRGGNIQVPQKGGK